MCDRIDVPLQSLTPPLRLVLNTECNGNCPFCHHEGITSKINMDPQLVFECATIAEQLGIPHISLTGGEPTLRKDLSSLITGIQNNYSGKISLTTNGFALSPLSNLLSKPLHTVNLSMISLSGNIAKKYQNVDPHAAIDALMNFPALNKNLNIVIVEDNYLSIKEIAQFALEHSLSLHIMFQLKEYSANDLMMQTHVLNDLRTLGLVQLQDGTTPTLAVKANKTTIISVKHPYLSRLVTWEICKECETRNSCYERICAVRVYPNGLVTPCLNGHISFSQQTTTEKLTTAYSLFDAGNMIYDIQSASILTLQ